jgi:hypothetical protein
MQRMQYLFVAIQKGVYASLGCNLLGLVIIILRYYYTGNKYEYLHGKPTPGDLEEDDKPPQKPIMVVLDQ